jgi:nitroreductase
MGVKMIKDMITKNRSYRRFYGEKAVTMDQLKGLVDLARLSPSMANRQPLKYVLICDPKMNEKVFEHLGWAGYLQDWPGPVPSERPTAYIVMLRDTTLTKVPSADEGIHVQSMLLGAVEQGLGGCVIGNYNKENLAKTLDLDADYEPVYVIALGYPKEEVVIDSMGEDGNIKYWRDENQVHHVPKRSLEELILKEI